VRSSASRSLGQRLKLPGVVPDSLPTSDLSPLQRFRRRWQRLLVSDDPGQRRQLAGMTLLLILAIGLIDFLVGFEISLLVFYCLPVVLATVLGLRFGIFVALASVAIWIGGDIAAGAKFQPVSWWNAGIGLGTYLVVVWLVNIIRTLHREMEGRVRDRTAALTNEIRERERLEKAILEITERERRSIGHDLHDGLGQHLTGTAFAGQVLCEKLQARQLAEEEADAWKIVRLVEDGIDKTRRLAKGLLLAEIQRDGLVPALQELARTTSAEFRVTCTFEAKGDCNVAEAGVATHLLRVAQEAVRNAVRHSGGRQIAITLQGAPEALELTVLDRGRGLPTSASAEGLGLRIMARRAEMIGAKFTIAAAAGGGTVVTCRLPRLPR
jgi:signal transduction histidine kinase